MIKTKTEYRYDRDENNVPIITYCSIKEFEYFEETQESEFIRQAVGIATCNNSKDIPCKKVGRSIALHRALKVLNSRKPLVKDSGFLMGFHSTDELFHIDDPNMPSTKELISATTEVSA